jgi:sigma-B regulation protein RsbU (phosphoserine phosphatase)
MTKMHEAAKQIARLTNDPLHLLASVNDSLLEDLQKGSMVTATLAVFAPDGRRVSIVRAGHCPSGIVRAAAKSLEWDEPQGVALGVLDKRWASFTRMSEIELGEGDGLLLFTDGVSEAMNAAREEFGFEGVEKFAQANTGLAVEDFVSGLLASIGQFTAGAPQSDDIAIVYARRQGGA